MDACRNTNHSVEVLCEPLVSNLRVDVGEQPKFTREDMLMVLTSKVDRSDTLHIDLAGWRPLFTVEANRQEAMSNICKRLESTQCTKTTVLNISNCGWRVDDMVKCLDTVASIGKRLCVPAVSVLPVGWSKMNECYQRPDGMYVHEAPPTMSSGAYHALPATTAQMRTTSKASWRCVHCTMQVAAHAPPLGNLLTLNLSDNSHLGDTVTPSNWIRDNRLPTTTPRKPSAHKWTHAYNGEVYFGESPPGSVLLGGAKALGNALLHHQTLTEVDVSRTGLRDGGCAHLVRGLKNNVSHASTLDSVSNL